MIIFTDFWDEVDYLVKFKRENTTCQQENKLPIPLKVYNVWCILTVLIIYMCIAV